MESGTECPKVISALGKIQYYDGPVGERNYPVLDVSAFKEIRGIRASSGRWVTGQNEFFLSGCPFTKRNNCKFIIKLKYNQNS